MKLLVSAGERSGDEHAARVVSALKKLLPSGIECRGMGGSALKAEGVELLVDFETHGAVMGVSEVLKTLPRHFKELAILKNALKEWKPDAVLLVDYAEFNSILAKAAKKLFIPAYHFIPPQAWVWRESRVESMKSNLIGAGVLFPFEEKFYHDRGFLTAKFLGHPLVDSISKNEDRFAVRSKFGIAGDSQVLALFPGSRKQEINKHLPIFIEVVNSLSNKIPNLIPLVAASKELKDEMIPPNWKVHRGDSLEVLEASDVGLIKSGTSNLQAALIGLPFAMIYITSFISACVGHAMLKISQFSIVNLLVPGTIREFIQKKAKVDHISQEILRLFNNKSYREEILKRFEKIRSELSKGDFKPNQSPQERVASHLLELLRLNGFKIS